MSTIAIIGASYLQRPLVEKAKKMGLKTICFAWAEGAVCAKIADEFYPISIVEKDSILDICQKEKIGGICTIASDIAAPTVAYVAEKMHLNGNRYEVAKRANDKYLMREAFSFAGILSPRYSLINRDEKKDFSEWRFPLIVKPCDRSGSLGVMKVETLNELQVCIDNAQSLSFKQKAIVEEFIEGREISVEFISYHGKHYPLAITDKVTTGSPHFVELEHHQPAELSESQYKYVYKLTEKALNALRVTDGASHTEYKITEEGEVYIIELGARMGGDFIGSDLVMLSTGYDYLKGVIDVALNSFEEPSLTERQHSGVFFICKETERLMTFFNNNKDHLGIVKKELFDPTLKTVSCSADRSGYIIYKSERKLFL